ncbi:MAG TPA: hypothetical protein VMS99_16905 [Acidimicrobiia bacterium]|nr:hypothetical protein [Acidimicrobiia bacterium]
MRKGRVFVALALTVAACTSGAVPTESGDAGPTSSASTTVTSAVAGSQPDLSVRPLVWLTPQPYTEIRDVFEGGSVDFFDLFPADAPWSVSADRIHVFKLYVELGFGGVATNEEWLLAIEGVAKRGIALAMELGPLPDGHGCGGGEGFGGNYSLDQVRKVQRLGGRVDVVAFGSPYGFGHFGDGPYPTPCHWSLERIATETAEFVTKLREIEPDVVIGGIEPLWPGLTAEDFGDWMDGYEAATGEPLAFLHLDVDWKRHDWAKVTLEVEQEARARGVAFGVLYNGGDQVQSDQAWAQLTADRIYTYEQVMGGRPDHMIVQSWHVQPSRVLPDTDPSSLTGLVNRYFGDRTRIDGSVIAGQGGLAVDGSLSTIDVSLVDGAVLDVGLTPLEGTGQVLVREGTVPEDVDTAEVGIRINTEGGGPGDADIKVYELGYYEGSEEVNRVTDPSFGALAQFDIDGVSVVPSDIGDGTMLRLTTSSLQEVNLGSPRFAVTPGTGYRFTVSAGIPEGSARAGYAVVVFLQGDVEKARHILPLAPVPIPLAEVTSGPSGEFHVEGEDLQPGRYRLRVSYQGDLDHWPSYFEQEVIVE